MFYIYIYFIADVPRYVGKGVGSRWKAHRTPKVTTKLGRTLKKVFKETGAWIEPTIIQCESEEASFAEEKRLTQEHGREDLGTGVLWNLTDGGDGTSGHRHTEEFKDQLKKRTGENNPFFGKTHSAEVRKIVSETHRGHSRLKGTKLTLEHRKNISTGITGDRNPASKIKREDHPKVFELYESGLRQKQIGEIFGITQGQVSKILLKEKYYAPIP